MIYAGIAVLAERGVRGVFRALDEGCKWREQWRAEARAGGRAQGRAEGRTEALAALLRLAALRETRTSRNWLLA